MPKKPKAKRQPTEKITRIPTPIDISKVVRIPLVTLKPGDEIVHIPGTRRFEIKRKQNDR